MLLGISKGGFAGLGMAGTVILANAVSPIQAIGILLPIQMVQDIFTVYNYRKEWSGRILAIALPGAVAGVALAYGVASYVSDLAIMLLIGVVSIVFALQQALRRKPIQRTDAPPRVIPGVLSGAASGFCSMIANAGGAPFQIYILPLRLPPAIFVGTNAMFFAFMNWLKLIPIALLGQLSLGNLATSTALLPLAIASTWLGIWLIRRMSSAKFYPVITALLFCIGLRLLWTSAKGFGWM